MRNPHSRFAIIVRRIPGGYAMDSCKTPDAPRVQRLFGTTCLPMPITDQLSPDEALEFARQTPAGIEFGVFPEVL